MSNARSCAQAKDNDIAKLESEIRRLAEQLRVKDGGARSQVKVRPSRRQLILSLQYVGHLRCVWFNLSVHLGLSRLLSLTFQCSGSFCRTAKGQSASPRAAACCGYC